MTRSGGSLITPSPVQANEFLGVINFLGVYDSSGDRYQGATISAQSSENFSSGSAGSQLAFYVTANGTLNPQRRMTIENDGDVGIGTSAPDSKLHVSGGNIRFCLLYTSPSPRDKRQSRMPSSA